MRWLPFKQSAFGRGSLLLSLIQESTLACLTGALVAPHLSVLLQDVQTIPFSIGSFTLEIVPSVAFAGIATGLFLGLLGALRPAILCLKPSLHSALQMS